MEISFHKNNTHAKYRKIFRGLDEDKSGLIKIEDVASTLRNAGNDVSESELQEILSTLTGSNQTRCIVFEEFVYLMLELNMEIVEDNEIAKVFRYFDKDGDGFISPSDLKELLTSMGDNISEKDLKDMIEEADKDGDGKVSYQDFRNVMAVQEIKTDEGTSRSQIGAVSTCSSKTIIPEFDENATDSERMLPKSAAQDSRFPGTSFAAGAKRRMSCFLFGTPSTGKDGSSSLQRPRSRSSCGNLAALKEHELAKNDGMPRARRSFGSSPSFLKDLFKKK